MTIRLIAFDLDGTLMGPDQTISPRVQAAIARAQAQDIVVTLATGRMFSTTRVFAHTLNISAPLICYQGGWIQALDSDVLHRISLPKSLAQQATGLGDAQGWHTVLYADGKLYIREMLYAPDFYDAWLAPDVTVVNHWEDVLATHTVDKVLYVAEPEHIATMARILNQHFANSAEVVQSHEMFVEVVPQNVDKGTALAWLAQHLDISQAEVLAAGDQGNDLAMVKWAGIGVAMGNAISAVKQVADWVAPSVTEDGAAVLLERFVFKRGNM